MLPHPFQLPRLWLVLRSVVACALPLTLVLGAPVLRLPPSAPAQPLVPGPPALASAPTTSALAPEPGASPAVDLAPAASPLPPEPRPSARPSEPGPSAALEVAPAASALALVPAAAALAFGPATTAQAQTTVPVSADEVSRGDPSLPNMALVFNVGAGFEPATDILDVLNDKHLKATFFVMGWWAERHPDVLRQIADQGHEIASHGHSIFDLTQASDAQVRADLEAADAAISGVTGRGTRPLWSPSAGYRDARVRAIAADLGYRPIVWTVDSGDWTAEASAESVFSHVVGGASNGAIVVLHFDSPRTESSTAQVLGPAIDTLREQGYRLMTISELLAAAPAS